MVSHQYQHVALATRHNLHPNNCHSACTQDSFPLLKASPKCVCALLSNVLQPVDHLLMG